MMRALWSAASGMKGQQTNMDVIANNIANVNTYGGKKVRAEFQDLIYVIGVLSQLFLIHLNLLEPGHFLVDALRVLQFPETALFRESGE